MSANDRIPLRGVVSNGATHIFHSEDRDRFASIVKDTSENGWTIVFINGCGQYLNRMKLWAMYIEEATEWHWCKNCPEYPRGDRRLLVFEKPKYGSFCTQCADLETAGQCEA